MAVEEVVVGATKRELIVTIVDENNVPVNLTGGSVRLQGKSSDLPGINIDQPGVLSDPANGVAKWAQLGTFITSGQLTTAVIDEATYKLRIKFTDAAAKFDYGDFFQIKWSQTPV